MCICTPDAGNQAIAWSRAPQGCLGSYGIFPSKSTLEPNRRGCIKRGCKSQNCGKKQTLPNLREICRICAKLTNGGVSPLRLPNLRKFSRNLRPPLLRHLLFLSDNWLQKDPAARNGLPDPGPRVEAPAAVSGRFGPCQTRQSNGAMNQKSYGLSRCLLPLRLCCSSAEE